MIKLLNGEWLFKQSDKNEWLPATVPGCNFLDLMDNGLLDDPFLKLNEKDASWVGEKDWEYKKVFTLSKEDLDFDRIIFGAKMLDTVCDVYLNSKPVKHCENCFIKQEADVKEILCEGENELKIYFHSPVNYVKQKYAKCATPINSNGQNGIVHIRKPQCHFGWDWGPVLPPSGITDDIYLEFVKSARIGNFTVKQEYLNPNAVINAFADVEGDGAECEITVTAPNGEVLKKNGFSAEFNIDEPELWWTYELSQKEVQPLYTVTARIFVNGKAVDESTKKIGIRKIELNTELDEYGKNFQFRLNGVPLFIKGANYIPADSFITRYDEDKEKYFLNAARYSNLNMLRIWGGGYYGSDRMYSLCDEMGILLWQDFQFACQAYPFFDDAFLENVKQEVRYNVNRISHHPSLAVWCGNNEIEDMHMAWINMPKYIKWTETFFYNILEPELRLYDTQTPFTPGSPIGISHNNGVYADNVGDTHLWGVWHGLKPMNYYRKRMTRFCSEFGFESLPDMNAIRIFADKSDYDLNSPVFLSHQKCLNGNDKMIYYIATRFNLPKHFRDYVYLSQVTQLECIADATEHWRRNKGRCNGSMYWQFNDCWGVCSWSSIDYYGNYKALEYGARNVNAPLSVSVEDSSESIKIWALNDFNEQRNIEVAYELFDFEQGTIKQEKKALSLEAVKNEIVFDLSVKELSRLCGPKHSGIAVTLFENGNQAMQKVVLFDKEKNLALPKSKLSTKIYKKNNCLELHIKTDKFARLVKAECSASHYPFSDNFFDILPNGEKIITIKKPEGVSLDELAESIVVYSLTDIEFDKSKIKSFAKQAKLYFSPINIGNAVHHGKVPKDCKL